MYLQRALANPEIDGDDLVQLVKARNAVVSADTLSGIVEPACQRRAKDVVHQRGLACA